MMDLNNLIQIPIVQFVSKKKPFVMKLIFLATNMNDHITNLMEWILAPIKDLDEDHDHKDNCTCIDREPLDYDEPQNS